MKHLVSAVLFGLSSIAMAMEDKGFYDYRQGNYQKARSALENLKKDKLALYYLGQMTLNGYALPKNKSVGIGLIAQAASRGYLDAQLFMAQYALKMNQAGAAFKWFKRAADKGNVAANMYVASAYLHGYGVKRNTDKARRYYIFAAKRGNAVAQTQLAEHFFNRRSYRSKKLAKIWLKKALKQDNTNAMVLKGRQYLKGRRFRQEPELAKALFEQAAKLNNPKAYYELGRLAEQSGEFYGYDDAIKWYRQAVDKKNRDAMYRLGLLLLPNKPSEGVALLQAAASAGNKAAMRKLALLYKRGTEVEKNEELAKKWSKKAKIRYQNKRASTQAATLAWIVDGQKTADLRAYQFKSPLVDWRNQAALADGRINETPQLATVQKKEIFSPNFSLATPQDIDVYSIINVLAKHDGQETRFKPEFPHYELDSSFDLAAFEWQAHHGDGIAQFKLGLAYQYGVGVERNPQLAREWFIKAVKQKNVRAEYQLGLMYLIGNGVEKNFEKGLYWLNKSAFKGNAMSQFVLAVLYDNGYQTDDPTNYVAPDSELAINMYNLAASEGVAKAQLKLASLYAKEMAGRNYPVAEQKKMHRLSHELYYYAYRNGMKQAALPLAYYLVAKGTSGKDMEWAFDVAKKLAAKGNHQAALLLGLLYQRGQGVAKSEKLAAHWFDKAAKLNNPVADFMLGTMYYAGMGVSQDKSKSLALLEKASRQGLAYADYNLAMIKHAAGKPFLTELNKAVDKNYAKAELVMADYYLLNPGPSHDMQRAADIYRRLANFGYAKAQLKLAYLYQHGVVFEKNNKQAFDWYRSSARQDEKVAQFLVGNLYLSGQHGKQDIAKAKYWYERAAKQQFVPAFVALGFVNETYYHDYTSAEDWYYRAAHSGSPQGQYDLALMYLQGKGLQVDRGKAVKWLDKAASHGNAAAQSLLGQFYLHGDNVKKSAQKAYHYFIDAARLGDRDAYYQLGLLYETGVGTQQDVKRAVSHYAQAATLGSIRANFALGRLYEHGIGVTQDKGQATRFYQKAAKDNNVAAQYRLGLLYFEGLSDEPNAKQAKAYFKQAANNGSYRAKEYYKYLSRFGADTDATRASRLEPIPQRLSVKGQDNALNLLYLNAITGLNEGELKQSRAMLNQIRQRFPDFYPAQQLLKNI